MATYLSCCVVLTSRTQHPPCLVPGAPLGVDPNNPGDRYGNFDAARKL